MDIGKTRWMTNVAVLLALVLSCGASHGLASTAPEAAKNDGVAVSKEAQEKADAAKQEMEALKALYVRARKLLDEGDTKQASDLFRKAAESGHPLAMHELGLILRHSGNAENLREAAAWYRRAAEYKGWGFPGSQNNLGDMYETGDGVGKSSGDAIYWYTRSALQGEPTAYFSLGLCFADGIGVAKDFTEAFFWLTLAVEHLSGDGNRGVASAKMAEIEKTMSPGQIAEAKRKAAEFRPYYQTKLTIGDPPAKKKDDKQRE